MKLYTSPTTPFGRKVGIVARELGIAVDEETINVFEAEWLDESNPLRQIPTLVLDDGTVLYDSHVICAYLDSASEKPSLYPEPGDWVAMRRASLANGLIEASVQFQLQKILPEDEQSARWKTRVETRMNRVIDQLEQETSALGAGGPRIDQITAAAALGHVEFRHTKSWRDRCPRLAEWFDKFSRRPSMVETQHPS